MNRISVMLAAGAMAAVCLPGYAKPKNMPALRQTDEAFYATDEARRVGEQVLAFQRVTGGWPKNTDMERPLTAEQLDSVRGQKTRMDDSTTDNLATTTQLTFLARLYKATRDARYREAFRAGMEYLLAGQYPGGGWPQFWPSPKGYQVHITYNDGAMANTMTLIDEVARAAAPYDAPGLVDDDTRRRLAEAFSRGIDCVLATQIVVDGRPTVWCQQHDHLTLAPAKARAYELPSFCSQESAQLVAMLMRLPEPDERVKRAVHGAMRWLDDHKLMGYAVKRTGKHKAPDADTRLVESPGAGALWGRYYDLDSARVFVCDRDGVPRRSLEEIGRERRNGYSWYNDHPAYLYEQYDAWADLHDPARKEAIDMTVAARLREQAEARQAERRAARKAARKAK